MQQHLLAVIYPIQQYIFPALLTVPSSKLYGLVLPLNLSKNVEFGFVTTFATIASCLGAEAISPKPLIKGFCFDTCQQLFSY